MQPVRLVLAASVVLAAVTGATLGLAAPSRGASAAGEPPHGTAAAGSDDALATLARRAFGRSGALRVVMTDPATPLELPLVVSQAPQGDVSYQWLPVLGTRNETLLGRSRLATGLQAPGSSGIWRLRLSTASLSQDVDELAVITRVPLSAKRGGVLNGYRIGDYVTEGQDRGDRYAPPPGFIEVTPDNQDLLVSEHFKLRNFLTKNQFDVWPKYLALDLRLIDKLELVIQELNAMGVRAEHMAVMSGFRTPAYNIQGVGEGGRALLSRHTYGDASDVWIDNDRDGYIDDLNGDGRRDVADAEVMLRAVERVEARYPELIGGAGVYLDNGAHGPFIHIDTRGSRSRW